MKKFPMSIICGIAAILVTIIAYLLVLDNVFYYAMFFMTLVGVVLAEAAVTVLAYRSKGDPRKVAATAIAAIMVPVALVLSIVYVVNFPEGYGSYLGLYFMAAIIIFAIDAVIIKFADSKKSENDALQNAKNNILGMRKLVKCIMLKQNAANFKKELDEIEEKLHFSNDAVITAMDANISRMLMELEDNIDKEEFNAAEHISAISKEIDRRNIFAKSTI